jgi:hypothetical protein
MYSSCEPVPLVGLLYVKVHYNILTIRLLVQILTLLYNLYNYLRHSLSLSNFFNSENIGLRSSLSLSNFFDSDKECLNPILEQNF